MVCGGLWWFACIVSGFTAYRPNSGGGLRWCVVVLVVYGGLRSFAVICGGLSFSHTVKWCTSHCDRARGKCKISSPPLIFSINH